jgi:choline-sulfatase
MRQISRRSLIASGCGMVLHSLAGHASSASPNPLNAVGVDSSGKGAVSEKPNILFICSDQHAAWAVGANGHPIVKTPNMDRLAAAGTNFRNAYCGNPVCAPSRAGLMTGMFPSDVKSYCNSTPFDGHSPTWGNRLQDAGYDCWATGKLDLCRSATLGFQEFETTHEHATNPDISSLFRSPLCWRAEERGFANGSFDAGEHVDATRARNGVSFLRKQEGGGQKPWCAWVGFTEPHPVFNARAQYEDIYPPAKMSLAQWPDGYLERRHPVFQMLASYKDVQLPVPAERQRNARAAYFGMITEMDKFVGELLDALEESGQLKKTIIIYTSDHGEMMGEHGLWLKNNLLDSASRVPLIIAGPGIPAGKVIHAPVSHVDLVATLMESANAKPDGLRGRSLWPLLAGGAASQPSYAYSESHSEGNATGSFMVRKDDWKYIYFTGGDSLLFDMSKPFGEYNNLSSNREYSSVVEELHGRLVALVDPDAITYQAFHRQDEVLRGLVRKQSKAQFYKSLVGRLGSVQSAVFAERYYL